MNLLERYLNAVGEHLPRRHRADTLAELRANLESEIEAREDALNHPLTEQELAQLLEAHGMPVLVAARYGPQQFLIGPVLFPFYWYTLRRSAPWVVAIYAALCGVTTFLQATSGAELGARIGAAALRLPAVLLTFWAVMTLGFAVFEFAQGHWFPKLTLPRWSASDLPDARPEGAPGKSTVAVVADLILSVLFVAWLLALPQHPFLIFGPGNALTRVFHLVPDWQLAYWPIVGLYFLMIPLKGMMLVPALRDWQRYTDLTCAAIGIGVLGVVIHMGQYFVAGEAISPDALASLPAINTGLGIALRIALLLASAHFCWDAWKLISAPRGRAAGFVAAK